MIQRFSKKPEQLVLEQGPMSFVLAPGRLQSVFPADYLLPQNRPDLLRGRGGRQVENSPWGLENHQ